MRTSAAATSDVANQTEGEAAPVFYDPLFRDSKGRIVEPPDSLGQGDGSCVPKFANYGTQEPSPCPNNTDAPSPKLGVRVADSHAHLDMLHHPELALARCAAHGVGLVVTVVDPTEDPLYTCDNLDVWLGQARDLLDEWVGQGLGQGDGSCVQKFANFGTLEPSPCPKPTSVSPPVPNTPVPEVRIIAGCHPHNARNYDIAAERLLVEVAANPRCAGIGEIGLDYHYDLSPRDVQQRVFRRQIALAHELGLPIALHLREAHGEGLRILREEGLPAAGTLLHCFNLDYATLEPFLELGCQVAFGGALTFKKSDEVRDAARRTPPERIMTETDAPFMAPHPLRGVVCGPEHVIFTAARLVEVFGAEGVQAQELLAQLYANARRFFG
jgi:TatD DNase family protein